MSRKTPERFFAHEPDAVDDLVEKSSRVLDALAEHKIGEAVAASEVVALKMRTIPFALVFKKDSRRDRFPFRTFGLFSTSDNCVRDLFRNLLPLFALCSLGVRMPIG